MVVRTTFHQGRGALAYPAFLVSLAGWALVLIAAS